MGRRDIPKREVKKTRRDAKKTAVPIPILSPPPVVEVIKKKRKEGEVEEEAR